MYASLFTYPRSCLCGGRRLVVILLLLVLLVLLPRPLWLAFILVLVKHRSFACVVREE